MPFGKPKPTQFDQAQDKTLQSLITNQTQLIKNNQTFNQWIINLDQRLKAIETWIPTKDTIDKTQTQQNQQLNNQLIDGLNQINNTLKDLKTKSHEHTITQETKQQ